MLFRKQISKEYRPILNIADGTLRELIATFVVTFAICGFYNISDNGIWAMNKVTLFVFSGMFFGAGLFIFNADMNPALTFARWIRGLINFTELFARWSAQIGAALAAFGLIKLMGGTSESLMWGADVSLTGIDIVMIEGFCVAILITVLFGKYKKVYKPAIFGTVYVTLNLLMGGLLNTKINFLFILVPAIIFNTYSWHITFFAIAHLAAVSIMVIFWIKDSWTD